MELSKEQKGIENTLRSIEETKSSITERLDSIYNRYIKDFLEDEPADGIVLAVQGVNGKRLMRKFRPSSKGEQVYIWVAKEYGVDSSSIELMVHYNGKISKQKTLGEQGIQTRTSITVNII